MNKFLNRFNYIYVKFNSESIETFTIRKKKERAMSLMQIMMALLMNVIFLITKEWITNQLIIILKNNMN